MPQNSKDPSPIVFVLLGASNLARGHLALANCLQRSLYPRPVRFLYALGPGRGYRAWGGFLRMVYPPIRSSRIFSAARENSGCQVVAVVTDIGNDIMYNVPPGDIMACLEDIFQRLRECDALILATPIPSSLETDLSRFSFLFLRSIFYPNSRVSHQKAVASIGQINGFLKDSAKQKVRLLSGLEEFSGWDKIHFSLWRGHLAWSRIARQILQALQFDANTAIGYSEMLASYGANVKQMITADLLSLQNKGPEYF